MKLHPGFYIYVLEKPGQLAPGSFYCRDSEAVSVWFDAARKERYEFIPLSDDTAIMRRDKTDQTIWLETETGQRVSMKNWAP